MQKKILTIILMFSLLFLSSCRHAKTSDSITKSGIYFDTVISIELYDYSDEAILTDAFELCELYENLFSKSITTSDVSKINQSMGEPVEVSPETIVLLTKAIYYSELTGGSFDITIAPLSTLWNFTSDSKEKSVPSDADIQSSLSHVNYKNIIINDTYVSLSDPLSQIDLGGIAKGYIADKLKIFLTDKGVTHGLINLGGNVVAIGDKPDHSGFTIGIQKPFDKRNISITSISVKDKSVVSSGVYERYFKIGDSLYHHILDPKTGYPYNNDLLGVTIISPQSVDGDALSTACFSLGLEKGFDLIQSIDNTEAIFITKNYEIIKTSDQL